MRRIRGTGARGVETYYFYIIIRLLYQIRFYLFGCGDMDPGRWRAAGSCARAFGGGGNPTRMAAARRAGLRLGRGGRVWSRCNVGGGCWIGLSGPGTVSLKRAIGGFLHARRRSARQAWPCHASVALLARCCGSMSSRAARPSGHGSRPGRHRPAAAFTSRACFRCRSCDLKEPVVMRMLDALRVPHTESTLLTP